MTVARLEINQAKLDACWLDLTHKDGGSKAKFFLAGGFTKSNAAVLALAQHALRTGQVG